MAHLSTAEALSFVLQPVYVHRLSLSSVRGGGYIRGFGSGTITMALAHLVGLVEPEVVVHVEDSSFPLGIGGRSIVVPVHYRFPDGASDRLFHLIIHCSLIVIHLSLVCEFSELLEEVLGILEI